MSEAPSKNSLGIIFYVFFQGWLLKFLRASLCRVSIQVFILECLHLEIPPGISLVNLQSRFGEFPQGIPSDILSKILPGNTCGIYSGCPAFASPGIPSESPPVISLGIPVGFQGFLKENSFRYSSRDSPRNFFGNFFNNSSKNSLRNSFCDCFGMSLGVPSNFHTPAISFLNSCRDSFGNSYSDFLGIPSGISSRLFQSFVFRF